MTKYLQSIPTLLLVAILFFIASDIHTLTKDYKLNVIQDKPMINEEEAALYLGLNKSEFDELIKNQEILKEEALGLSIDENAFLQWLHGDKSKSFSTEQIDKWVYFNTTNKEPLFRE